MILTLSIRTEIIKSSSFNDVRLGCNVGAEQQQKKKTRDSARKLFHTQCFACAYKWFPLERDLHFSALIIQWCHIKKFWDSLYHWLTFSTCHCWYYSSLLDSFSFSVGVNYMVFFCLFNDADELKQTLVSDLFYIFLITPHFLFITIKRRQIWETNKRKVCFRWLFGKWNKS